MLRLSESEFSCLTKKNTPNKTHKIKETVKNTKKKPLGKRYKTPIISESEIQKSIIEYFAFVGIRCERLNTGSFSSSYKGKKDVSEKKRFIRFGFVGCPDLILLGWPFLGGCGFIEVKNENNDLSDKQYDFMIFCRDQKIPYLLATSLDDVIAWIKTISS